MAKMSNWHWYAAPGSGHKNEKHHIKKHFIFNVRGSTLQRELHRKVQSQLVECARNNNQFHLQATDENAPSNSDSYSAPRLSLHFILLLLSVFLIMWEMWENLFFTLFFCLLTGGLWLLQGTTMCWGWSSIQYLHLWALEQNHVDKNQPIINFGADADTNIIIISLDTNIFCNDPSNVVNTNAA